jgi:hypothetical protein
LHKNYEASIKTLSDKKAAILKSLDDAMTGRAA